MLSNKAKYISREQILDALLAWGRSDARDLCWMKAVQCS